ncbi:MAG TPA: ABC transporter permease [Verrucomicrobiae bacterium]|nr:ABC transporter permease [Verrucomicrobiae bacterium]
MNPSTIKTPRAAFKKLVLNEFRLMKRVPIGLVLGLGLPVMLLIIFGLIPDTGQASKDLGGQSYFAVTFPVLLSLVIMSQSVMMLPRVLVAYRETGFLRRLSTTPAPPAWLLAAQVVVNLVVIVIGSVLLTAVGMLAFHLNAPKDWLGFLVAIILAAASMFAVGLCIAATAPNNGVAQALGGILFFVLLFFGGLWLPRPLMPKVLLDVSNWIPFGAAVGAMQNAMQGAFPTAQSLVCLVASVVIFGYLAVRYFRWE